MQGIESTMLKSIREGTHEPPGSIANNNNYIMEELNFRMHELETQFHSQYAKLKSKIDKITPNNRKNYYSRRRLWLGGLIFEERAEPKI